MSRTCVFWRREAANLAVQLESSIPGTHRRKRSGRWVFLFLGANLSGCKARAPVPINRRKGETAVPDITETTKVASKAAGIGISLDVWAVALALGLALLVWLGWIKHVP